MTSIKSGRPAYPERSAPTGVEGEIRDFVRRDAAPNSRRPDIDSDIMRNNIGPMLQRISASSIQEIDRLITELQELRALLQSDGERVRRKIARYSHLNEFTMNSTKIVAESLAQLRGDLMDEADRDGD